MVTENIMDTLAEALLPLLESKKASKYGVSFKHDVTGNPITAGYNHGPGGLLTYPGVDSLVYHSIVGPQGILSELPTSASPYSDPTYFTITGVQDVTGAEKNAVCADAPVAGLMKGCLVHSVFGRYERQTPQLELNRLGKLVDRADPIDLRLVGSPIAQSGPFASGPGNPSAPGDVLTNEVNRKFWELAIAFHRLLSVQLWRGNPANNAAGGGYREMTGFQLLVNTGYQDAETDQNCPAMDSDLKNFNFRRIDQNGNALVEALSYLYRTRRDLAFRTGMLPVRWVFAMRQELFWELSAVWPCSYLTYMCQVSGNQRVNIDAGDQIRMRDEMRAGKFLLIDGERIDVVLDDGIPEATNASQVGVTAGCFASDVYLIPMSVVGGQAVTFLEYADFSNPSLSTALSNMVMGRVEGAFLTWPRQTNQCVQWQSKIEPRLVLRTPWLAGRLQNVMYCPLQHARQPFPTDPYFTDGGKTSRPGPSYQGLWN